MIREPKDGEEIPPECKDGFGRPDLRKSIAWVCDELTEAETDRVYEIVAGGPVDASRLIGAIRMVLAERRS